MTDDTHTAAELMQWLVDRLGFGLEMMPVTMPTMPEWIFDLCAQSWKGADTPDTEDPVTLEDWKQLLRDEGFTVEGE